MNTEPFKALKTMKLDEVKEIGNKSNAKSRRNGKE